MVDDVEVTRADGLPWRGLHTLTRKLTGLMMAGLAACSLTAGVLADEPVRELVLDDFTELGGWSPFWEPKDIEPEKISEHYSTISISNQWASRGKTSLKIEGKTHIPDVTTGWPGAVLRGFSIPMRDWQSWQFMSVDVKVVEDDTPILVLVQWGVARHNRISVARNLDAGEYRLWINLPKFASGGQLENLAAIFSVELLLNQPTANRTVYYDNLRLTNTFTPTASHRDILDVPDDRWQMVEQALNVPAPSAPRTSHLESLLQDPANLDAMDSQRLQHISWAAERRAAQLQASAQLRKDYPNNDHGTYIVPVDERVDFSGQRITHRWKRELNLIMGLGEVRSQYLVLARPVDQVVHDISMEMSSLRHAESGDTLPDSVMDTQLVGYIYLPENQQLHGMVPGWYADPVLPWKGRIGLDEKRQLQPLLLTFQVPRDATPGRYTGTVTTTSHSRDGKVLGQVQLPVTLDVANHTFPVQPTLRTIVSTGVYGDQDPEFFLDYRISPNNPKLGSIYLRGNLPGVDLKQVKAMIEKGMTAFNLRQAAEMHLFPQRATKTDQEIAEGFMDMLRWRYSDSGWDELVDNGVAAHAVVYGFDEVNLNSEANQNTIRAVFQAVKDKYGRYGVKTATTAHPMSMESLDLPVDIWIPSIPTFRKDVAAEARRRGAQVWVYTIDWEIWRPLLHSRSLPWVAYQLRAPGWLYYSFSEWPYALERNLGDDPLTDWDSVSWGSAGRYGTGGLIYRDAQDQLRASLRLVNFREGMYDHDLLVALRDLESKTQDDETKRVTRDLLVQADSHLLLAMPRTYDGARHGDKHTGIAESVGMMMDAWRQESLKLLGMPHP